MSKKFLASVGHAQLLGKKDGKLVHIADVQTLTESSLSFSSSMEDVRAGQGAKLYGRFNHTTGMSVTLTDAMFDLNFIGYQVGAEIEGDATGLYSETLAVTAGKVTTNKKVQDIGKACGLNQKAVWVKKVGACGEQGADWVAVTDFDDDGKVILPASLATETEVCTRYFINKPEARMISVNANFFPAEMTLILTTRLFAGDANNIETGKPIGSVTIKIPRFQLDGQFDLSMAMTSAASLSLNGTALAVAAGGCDDEGVYAEIVEIIDNVDYTYGLSELYKEDSSLVAVYEDGHMSELDLTETYIYATADSSRATDAAAMTVGATYAALSAALADGETVPADADTFVLQEKAE